MSELPRKKLFPLVGESFANDDGTSRQSILRKSQPGEELSLRRQPDNKFDKNAILVTNLTSEGLGHLDRESARIVAPLLDAGLQPRAYLHELKGGLPDYKSFGCVISIVWEGRKVPSPKPLEPEQKLYDHAPKKQIAKKSRRKVGQKTGQIGLVASLKKLIGK